MPELKVRRSIGFLIVKYLLIIYYLHKLSVINQELVSPTTSEQINNCKTNSTSISDETKKRDAIFSGMIYNQYIVIYIYGAYTESLGINMILYALNHLISMMIYLQITGYKFIEPIGNEAWFHIVFMFFIHLLINDWLKKTRLLLERLELLIQERRNERTN
jgi:hypothetical protein